MATPTCKKVCAGKKGNIMYEQCRDEEGKITKMRRIGDCDQIPSKGVSRDVEIVERG